MYDIVEPQGPAIYTDGTPGATRVGASSAIRAKRHSGWLLLVLLAVLLGTLLLAGSALAGNGPPSAGAPPPRVAAPQGGSSATPTATPACGGASAWQAGPTLTPGRALGSAVASDGKFYVAGGADSAPPSILSDADRFNPSTNTWEALAPMSVGVRDEAMGGGSGKVYVAGGWLGSAVTATLQIYNIAANTWSFGVPLPVALEDGAGVALNGNFYVMGGDDGLNSVRSTYIYSTTTGTWSQGADLPDIGGRTNTNATTVGGLIYVWGGVLWMNSQPVSTIDTMIVYNPISNTWTQLASANTGGLGNSGGVSPYGPGQLLISDGSDNNFTPSDTTQIYHIATDTYSPGPSLLLALLGLAQGTLPDGRVIVYGGDLVPTCCGMLSAASELLAPPVPCTTATATATPTRTVTPTRTATATATVCPVQYSDVDANNPFYAYIRCLACRGIVGGYTSVPPCATAPCFLPANLVTRGQMSKFVANAAGYADVIPSTQQTFTDVPYGSPFWLYVERAVLHGVISGYTTSPPCTTGAPCFLPSNVVTRGQTSKFVASAANYSDPIPSTQQTFTDVAYGSPFWIYTERAVLHGVISGYTSSPPCTTGAPCFLPGNSVTRGQTSKFIANAFYPACQTPRRP